MKEGKLFVCIAFIMSFCGFLRATPVIYNEVNGIVVHLDTTLIVSHALSEEGIKVYKLGMHTENQYVGYRFSLINITDSVKEVSLLNWNVLQGCIGIEGQPPKLIGLARYAPLGKGTYRTNQLVLTLSPQDSVRLFFLEHSVASFQLNKGVPHGVNVLEASVVSEHYYKYIGKRFGYLTWNFVFIAVLFFQLIVVFAQWLLFRRGEYVYYVAYAMVLVIYFFQKIDIYYQIGGGSTFFSGYYLIINNATSLLAQYFYFRFARLFLNLDNLAANDAQKLAWAERILLGLILVSIITGEWMPQWANMAYFGASIYLFVVATYFIIRIIKLKLPIATLFLTGSLFALVGNLLSLLMSLKAVMLIFDWPPLVFAQIGIFIEIAIFNIGFTYKTKLLEAEKQASQISLIEKLRENVQLQLRMQKIRDKISQDLHDDIGSTLSSIKIYSELAQKMWGKSPEKVSNLLSRIHQQSTQTLENMSDIVWSVNPERDKLSEIIFKMRVLGNEMGDVKNFTFSLVCAQENEDISLEMQVRKNLFLVFKEMLNNTAKYAEAQQVKVSLVCKNEILYFDFEDDGVGFETVNGLGNGLKNIEKRMTEIHATHYIQSNKGGGTHISLQIPIIRE